MTAQVRLEVDGAVATIVIDHAERRNAMTQEMWQQIPALCAEVEETPGVRVVVIRGAGDVAFVAGADISEFRDIRQGSGGEAYDRMTAAATDALATLSKPLVAVIHGFCIGGGLALALSADIRLASDQSTFGLPPARLGIGYSPTGIGHLVDLIGPAATKELIFTADWIDADKARRWGLVNDIFPPAELDAAAARMVATMAERAPLSQLTAKRAIANHLAPADRRDDVAIDELVRRCIESSDYQEGVAAFLAKRQPRFSGQ